MLISTARELLRTVAAMMAPCSVKAYGRNLMFWPRPGFKVTDCDLEAEIVREALGVTLNGLVEDARLDAVNPGEIAVEQHAVTAQDEDRVADLLDRHRVGMLRLSRAHRDYPVRAA